jgi:NAD(P)-dependent dehydrogenase (short-subunit alcohol dehydrogenase family)
MTSKEVVTLGGTRGIGKSIVEAFLSEGANVSYCARHVSGDEFAGFASDEGARAVGTAVDVGDEAALTAWVAKSVAEFGRLDTVIANGTLASALCFFFSFIVVYLRYFVSAIILK